MWRLGFVDEERHIGAGGVGAGTWWGARSVADLGVSAPITVLPSVTAAQAAELMAQAGVDQLPVVDASNNILGVVGAHPPSVAHCASALTHALSRACALAPIPPTHTRRAQGGAGATAPSRLVALAT
jgi:hypothetical protein